MESITAIKNKERTCCVNRGSIDVFSALGSLTHVNPLRYCMCRFYSLELIMICQLCLPYLHIHDLMTLLS